MVTEIFMGVCTVKTAPISVVFMYISLFYSSCCYNKMPEHEKFEMNINVFNSPPWILKVHIYCGYSCSWVSYDARRGTMSN